MTRGCVSDLEKEMAEKMLTIEDLMVTGLTYVLDFENKVSDEAKKMGAAASNTEAKDVFEKSVTKGKEYAKKIEQTFEKLGKPLKTNTNQIAHAMIQEVENMISNTETGPVRDAALIVAANQMQMYRVSAYGSMEAYAKLLGKEDAAKGMTENLEDSKGGDAKLTKIAEETVNQEALKASLQAA